MVFTCMCICLFVCLFVFVIISVWELLSRAPLFETVIIWYCIFIKGNNKGAYVIVILVIKKTNRPLFWWKPLLMRKCLFHMFFFRRIVWCFFLFKYLKWKYIVLRVVCMLWFLILNSKYSTRNAMFDEKWGRTISLLLNMSVTSVFVCYLHLNIFGMPYISCQVY